MWFWNLKKNYFIKNSNLIFFSSSGLWRCWFRKCPLFHRGCIIIPFVLPNCFCFHSNKINFMFSFCMAWESGKTSQFRFFQIEKYLVTFFYCFLISLINYYLCIFIIFLLISLLRLKGVFAKNKRGYRLNAIRKRFWSPLILLLSGASIRRKLTKTSHTEERSAHTNWGSWNIRHKP